LTVSVFKNLSFRVLEYEDPEVCIPAYCFSRAKDEVDRKMIEIQIEKIKRLLQHT